jgi:hypothetical protein
MRTPLADNWPVFALIGFDDRIQAIHDPTLS